MTLTELIVTAACSNVGAVILARIWSHYEHKDSADKLAEIHVLVNQRLDDALAEITELRAQLQDAQDGES